MAAVAPARDSLKDLKDSGNLVPNRDFAMPSAATAHMSVDLMGKGSVFPFTTAARGFPGSTAHHSMFPAAMR